MICQSLKLMLAVLLVSESGFGAQQKAITTDWTNFQQQVSIRKLSKRTVLVALTGGGEIKTTLFRVEDNGLIVQATKAAKQWASGPDQAIIPREQVSAVRFGGRTGHRGLIGGLVGLSAGVVFPLGIGASRGYEEVPTGLVAVVLGPALAIAGYLIGHFMDEPAPEFVIR